MPPLVFGSHILSHFIDAIFLSSLFSPHQKLRTMLVISSPRLVGNKKQLMVCAGMAWAIALISTSLPALDSNFSFPPDSLFAYCSFSYWKVFFFDLPTKDVRPRYFTCCLITSAPNSFLIHSRVSESVFWLKNSTVFSLLSWCPVDCLYTWRRCNSSSHSLVVAWKKNKLSSAKNEWDRCGSRLQMDMPLFLSSKTAFWIRDDMPSTHNKNK